MVLSSTMGTVRMARRHLSWLDCCMMSHPSELVTLESETVRIVRSLNIWSLPNTFLNGRELLASFHCWTVSFQVLLWWNRGLWFGKGSNLGTRGCHARLERSHMCQFICLNQNHNNAKTFLMFWNCLLNHNAQLAFQLQLQGLGRRDHAWHFLGDGLIWTNIHV